MKVIACYVRVSTVGQNEKGQRAELRRWLKANGMKGKVRWFVDKASGDNLDRPAFRELQGAVFNGEVSAIVVFKLDRISRSIRDGINTLADWCERGIRVVATSQQLDFNGSVGKLLAAVLLGLAELEQETRRERQAVGIEQAKKEGKYRGRKAGTTKANPARAKVLRAKGLSLSEIGRAMQPPVSRRTVARYLAD